jgi:Fe-S-cluster containining protein
LGGLACNGGCCRVRTYTDYKTYVETFCEHYNTTAGTCNIYEDRPEGCRRYPEAQSLITSPIPAGCGYYLEEDTA